MFWQSGYEEAGGKYGNMPPKAEWWMKVERESAAVVRIVASPESRRPRAGR